MSAKYGFHIRRMKRAEVDLAIEWAAAEAGIRDCMTLPVFMQPIRMVS